MNKDTTANHSQQRTSTHDFGRVWLARTRIENKLHSRYKNTAYDSPHIYDYLGIILCCIQEASTRSLTHKNWYKTMFTGSSIEFSEICDMLLL